MANEGYSRQLQSRGFVPEIGIQDLAKSKRNLYGSMNKQEQFKKSKELLKE